MVKRAMCHIRLTGLFLAILACLSILYTQGTHAQVDSAGASFVVDLAAQGEIAKPAGTDARPRTLRFHHPGASD